MPSRSHSTLSDLSAVLIAVFLLMFVCLLGNAANAQQTSPGGNNKGNNAAPSDIVGGPVAGLDFESQSAFRLGRSLFRREFTPANQGQAALDGLGPLINAKSCAQCHVNDGRGALPPESPPSDIGPGEVRKGPQRFLSMVLNFAPPHRIFGHQLQTHGVAGVVPEGQVEMEFIETKITLPDGEIITLRRPEFSVSGPQADKVATDQISGGRIASPMFGLGALAAIPEIALRAHHDPDDVNGDGISGRLHEVFSLQLGRKSIGRFGWKADMATLEDQIAKALALDMGLSSRLKPKPAGDCTSLQPACLQSPNGEATPFAGPEVSDASLGWLTFYSRALAVPSPRPGSGDASGQALFASTGCAACHTPSYDLPANAQAPYLGGYTIYPYTDLALHDLGEGLADRAARPGIDPAEWRTPPLWGVGVSAAINGNSGLLHDGRARTITEAIVWHGGEAASARDKFMALSKSQSEQLLSFVAAL